MSLNSSREFELTHAFVEEAGGIEDGTLRVVEFQDPGQDPDPESSFRKMVQSRQVCDGLVISGHHTGSFSGHRARGVLDIGFLEELSCDPQYDDFFRRVRAVWLQGCRTLGVGSLELDPESGREAQADYHMQRVGADLIRDGMEQSFTDLSFEFSATLDRDNPLASRYLRVFPAATVFGWTRSSPGDGAGGEKSLLFHLAHMVRLSRGAPLFDPLKPGSSAMRAEMSRSLWELLGGDAASSVLATEAWLSHGRVKEPAFGFDNPELNAYAPLLHSPENHLMAAKGMGCAIRSAVTDEALQAALTGTLSSPEYVAYNFDVIRDAFQRYKGGDAADFAALRNRLVNSESLLRVLNGKLKSPRSGLLMKIEYYSFYRELTGKPVGEVEAIILEDVRHFLLARDLAGSEYDIRDFRESLLLSLVSHDLADAGFYRELIRGPEAQNATLYTLVWTFLKQSPPGAGAIVEEIVGHPKVRRGTLRLAALWILDHGVGEGSRVLHTLVAHPEVDAETLGTVASVLSRYDLPAGGELARAIIDHPRAGSLALSQTLLAIWKYDIQIDGGLLDAALANPSLDHQGLLNAARVLGKSPRLGSADTLKRIIHHEQVDSNALSSVAIALGRGSFDDEPALIDTLRHHPKADARTLKYIDLAAARESRHSRLETID